MNSISESKASMQIFNEPLRRINSIKLNKIWDEIESNSTKFELSLNNEFKRNTGSYYTGLKLAKYMVDELFENAGKDFENALMEKSFLEPCVGTGNFVFSFLRRIYEIGFNSIQVNRILNNIYVCDTNKKALLQYKIFLKRFVTELWNIKLNEKYFSHHIGTGLMYNVENPIPSYISITDVFSNGIVKDGFDIIITNPPYKNLKAEKNMFQNSKQYKQEKTKYAAISNDAKKRFKYSNVGVLNLYKLFVEKILTDYSNENAYVSLLIPSTILSDKTCEKLRFYILNTHDLSHLNVIKENNPFINAQQSLCTLLLKKNNISTKISIVPDLCNKPTHKTIVSLKDIINQRTGNAIFSLPPKEYRLLEKMRKFPTIKELPFIINMRGELDLTSNSNYITSNQTFFPLIRGKNIGFFKLNSSPVDFVDETFVKYSKKKFYIDQARIICQQVVNIHKERRITFSFINKGYVLGNSCNFIYIHKNNYGIDLYSLLGLFNSPIMNWFFKLTSSNNHVNNYEIDSFPIPINSPYLIKIGELTKEYLKSLKTELLDQIFNLSYQCYGILADDQPEIKSKSTNNIVNSLYVSLKELIPNISIESTAKLLNSDIFLNTVITELGISIDSQSMKICKHIISKYQKILKGEIFNHTSFKLSNLDLEMVRTVPQGGNWKNIPQDIILKSKRLIRIKETGGRTTLYGRIDYTKPSYTITTYFNRPGNGSYIHPIYDRVLSVREAARLQSFKDNYFFYGNKTELLKQVGNAVPPLLAYQIGKSILIEAKCDKSLDLFCGAGGMTVGFKEAGIKTVLGTDINESACITFKANNPEIDILCGDISINSIKNKIIDISQKKGVEIVCGGPPCQGFSHAGKRFVEDPRNILFKYFIEVVSAVQPKIVIMENVEGMLTFLKGSIYRQIMDLFGVLGYKTEGRLLNATNFGVPQKRKRVIIICARNDLNLGSLFPPEITLNKQSQITAFDAIGDLERVPCSDDAKYIKTSISDYVKEMKGELSFGHYSDILHKTLSKFYKSEQRSLF